MQFRQKQNCILDLKSDYSFFFPVAFALAQRAFANAESFALAAALIFLRAFFTGLAASLTVLTAGLTDDFVPFIFAHRALAAALILAFAAALIVNFFLAGLAVLTAGFAALILAHLAFWAATILALPAALIPPFFFGALVAAGLTADGLAVEPNNWLNSFSSATIFSLRLAAWRNCWTDRSLIELICRELSALL